MIKAVIFGMNGVLYDSTHYVWEARRQYLRLLGAEMKLEDRNELLGLALKDQLPILEKKYDVKLDYAVFSKETRRIQIDLMQGKIQANEGVKEFIDWLQENNYKIAIASMNINRFIEQDLKLIGLDGKFDAITTVDDVVNRKPNPEYLLKTTEKLGLNPEQCIYVDDSPNGIKTAHQIGMNVLSLKSPLHSIEDYSGSDLVISSFVGFDLDKLQLKYLL